MVQLFVRVFFLLMICAVLWLTFSQAQTADPANSYFVLGCGLAVLVMGFSIDMFVHKKSLAALAGIFFGLIVGMLFGMAFNFILRFAYSVHDVPESATLPLQSLIYILCCFLAITFILQTKDDFRFIIPYVEFSKQTKGGSPLILDTSAIIDGRIADIAATGVFGAPLIVPRFVLNELQAIADSADRLRRQRGRRGLDILNKMQTHADHDTAIEDIDLTPAEKAEPVDHQLVSTALKLAGRIVTNDYNLNKVASLRGVAVINVNDLAHAVKPILLPGEPIAVRVVKQGDQPGQGVGYLEDGTMVVVEEGRNLVGQEVEAVVTSALQTSAGRMIFARMDDTPAVDRPRPDQRDTRGPARPSGPYRSGNGPNRRT